MSGRWGKYGKWILQGPDEQTRPPDAPPVRLRLFCVPQAGCGAWSFHGWSQHLPPDVEVMPVELPGRNSRMGESKEAESIPQLASETVDAIQHLFPAEDTEWGGEGGEEEKEEREVEDDGGQEMMGEGGSVTEAKETDHRAGRPFIQDDPPPPPPPPPYALFGHSMGAWIVYEMALEIRRRRRRCRSQLAAPSMPLKLYVCGNRAPHLAGPRHDPDRSSPAIANLPSDEFWRCFERRYGANPDLSHPSVRAFILPLLRADFRLVETYVCSSSSSSSFAAAAAAAANEARLRELHLEDQNDVEEDVAAIDPLDVPIAAIGAIGDNRYAPEQISQWRKHATTKKRDSGGGGGGGGGGRGGFTEHWFDGVSPGADKEGRKYWGTPHRIVLDYPKDLQAFLAEDLPSLYHISD